MDRCFHDVFQRGLMREQVETLEYHANARTLGGDHLVSQLVQLASLVPAVSEKFAVNAHFTSTNLFELIQTT